MVEKGSRARGRVCALSRTRVRLDFDCRTGKSLLATATDFALTGKLGGSKASFTIGELLKGGRGWPVDGLPTWIVAHRALPPALYALAGHFIDPGGSPSCCYLRVTQDNGQMAWSSPIWFED